MLLVRSPCESPVLFEDWSESPPLVLPETAHHHTGQVTAQLAGDQHGIVGAVEETLQAVFDDGLLHSSLEGLVVIEADTPDMLVVHEANPRLIWEDISYPSIDSNDSYSDSFARDIWLSWVAMRAGKAGWVGWVSPSGRCLPRRRWS